MMKRIFMAAIHEKRMRIGNAIWVSEPAAVEFSDVSSTLTGRTEEAKARLRHAIDLDKDARRLALDVEDLKPLWDWIADLE